MPGEEEEAEKLKEGALRHILTPIADRYVTEEWRRRFQKPHKELYNTNPYYIYFYSPKFYQIFQVYSLLHLKFLKFLHHSCSTYAS